MAYLRQKKCAESAPEVSYYLIGKNTASYYASPKVLPSCSNAASNLVHIDYTCIPGIHFKTIKL